jgi:ABC-type multidrug transport system ATPase subunit
MSAFTICATNLQKKYNKQVIIEALSFTYTAPQTIAITGINGRGKSTLIKLISGYVTPSLGQIEYTFGEEKIAIEDVFNYISIAAPYLDLIENMTALEMLQFHIKHKPTINQLSALELLELAYLVEHKNKPIASFSSGMKQRLKLVLAITANVPLLLLDEPTSNLDAKAKVWLSDVFSIYCKNKLVFIATNSVSEELKLCRQIIEL